jgi:hypothetical protein
MHSYRKISKFVWKPELRRGNSIFVLLRALFFAICFVLAPFTSGLGQPDEAELEPAPASSEVGFVSLVLGKAYILSGEKRAKASRGHVINVGDRIYTEANGHVHIRFVDDALVSVRPQSTLEVERYEFNRLRPSNSAVKFNLTEGVARSISGEAAKSARQRFRLNTPVAAIGVRGTDFVVSANSNSTRALVNEGSIVMAPFSSLCSSDALGPCSQNGIELAGDSFQVIEIDGSNLLSQVETEQSLGSLVSLEDRFRLSGQSGSRGNGDSDERDAATAYLEVAATGKVREADISSSQAMNQTEALIDFTPLKPLSSQDVTNSELVWGRFGLGKGSGELLSVERLTAAEARNVTIAAGDYLLYRTEVSGARIDSNLGVIGFNLDSAQAFYNLGSSEFTMRVSSGSLEVDFINNSFVTALNLDHALTGVVDFNGSGRVADGGYLIGLENAQSLLGAVATDGSEAGYFFEQQLDAGFVSGLTLWGEQ